MAAVDARSLVYTVVSLLNQLFGKGKEPFWQQAYTNLVRWIIELYRVLPSVRLEFPILSLNPGLEATLRGAWRLASSNEVRSHASLKGHTPLTFAGGHMVARAELNNVR